LRGQGGVGKSTTIDAMSGKTFDVNKQSTIGATMQTCELEQRDLSLRGDGKPLGEYKAVDGAGERMHASFSPPIPSHPLPSQRISSRLIASRLIPSHPMTMSDRISSHPIPSHHIQSHPILSHGRVRSHRHLVSSHLHLVPILSHHVTGERETAIAAAAAREERGSGEAMLEAMQREEKEKAAREKVEAAAAAVKRSTKQQAAMGTPKAAGAAARKQVAATPASPASMPASLQPPAGTEGKVAMPREEGPAAVSLTPPPVQPEVSLDLIIEYQNGKKKQRIVLHLKDTGGQPVFLAILDLLQAARATIFMLVFSLPSLQNAALCDGAIAQLRTQLDSFAVRALPATASLVPSSPSEPWYCPLLTHLIYSQVHATDSPVMLVGTRKAEAIKAHGDGALAQLSSELRSKLGDSPAFKNVVRNGSLCFFPIENSDGFEGDATIRDLVAKIEETALALPSMKQLVPASWLAVYDQLNKQHSSGKQWLPLDEVKGLAKQCGLPHAANLSLERENELMLTHFQSLGSVCWYGLHLPFPPLTAIPC
jgi:hypothetical protein